MKEQVERKRDVYLQKKSFKMASAMDCGSVFILPCDSENSIEFSKSAANMCGTIKDIIDDLGDSDEAIPIPTVEERILKIVKKYCEEHHNDEPPKPEEDKTIEEKFRDEPLSEFDKEIVNQELEVIFKCILAANYLNNEPMLQLFCRAVAELIRGKTPEELKKIFNIGDEFDEAAKEKIIAENPWLKDIEDEEESKDEEKDSSD